MSARTCTVLVADSFSDGTRDHPAMKWMEKFREWLDTNDRPNAAHWYSPNFIYVSPDGISTGPGEPGWNKMYDEYDAFYTKYHHEPYSIVCFEADREGCEYETLGQANVYGNLVGKHDGQPRVTNPKDGKEWDTVRPGAWHFWYEKTDDPKHEGYQMSRLHLMMDASPIHARLLNSGHMSHQDIIDKHLN